jgi:hypothetical protein
VSSACLGRPIRREAPLTLGATDDSREQLLVIEQLEIHGADPFRVGALSKSKSDISDFDRYDAQLG